MSSTQIKQRPIPSKITQHLSGYSPLVERILLARGVNHARQLDYDLKQLLPPQSLSNIDLAAELLADAVIADASVVIVGDFDADGATSCAVAMRCLHSLGLTNVSYLVPNRFEFGYGLSPEIVGVAATRQPDVIITVDNGISSVAGVHAAQALGMSVLITDHHLPGEELPTADVIVNPNLPNDRFASKNLAGVGVIFYVMLALRARLRDLAWFKQNKMQEPNLAVVLDLVALGTVADVVALDKNNRLLVQQGLQRIRAGRACPGIQALLTVANRNPARIAASDLGFAVGPRLNAAGRLDDMSIGIECLLADDLESAMKLALKLDALNRERREVEHSMQQDAVAIVDQISVDQEQQPAIYVLHDEGWHQGVVGLVASRIKERSNRPVLALAPSDKPGEWKGSARSVDGVHIRDLLARVDALYPELITKFGGHAMAAGLSLSGDKLGELQTAVQVVATDMTAGKDWRQVIWTDGELQADQFTLQQAQKLQELTPWGQAFPEPLFEGRFKVINSRTVGEVHAKLTLQPVDSNSTVEAICFGYLNNHEQLPSGLIRAVFRLQANEFRDRMSLQLLIQHIESSN